MAMNKAYFNRKYSEEINKIAAANDVDLNVAADMFISNIKAAFGICYTVEGELKNYDVYEGLPKEYNYKPAAVDLLGVI